MEAKRISPLKAIRLKCLDCCCGSSNEVKLRTVERCPLYPFRFGKNPNRAGLINSGSFEKKESSSISDFSENSLSEGTYIPEHNSEKIPDRMED